MNPFHHSLLPVGLPHRHLCLRQSARPLHSRLPACPRWEADCISREILCNAKKRWWTPTTRQKQRHQNIIPVWAHQAGLQTLCVIILKSKTLDAFTFNSFQLFLSTFHGSKNMPQISITILRVRAKFGASLWLTISFSIVFAPWVLNIPKISMKTVSKPGCWLWWSRIRAEPGNPAGWLFSQPLPRLHPLHQLPHYCHHPQVCCHPHLIHHHCHHHRQHHNDCCPYPHPCLIPPHIPQELHINDLLTFERSNLIFPFSQKPSKFS